MAEALVFSEMRAAYQPKPSRYPRCGVGHAASRPAIEIKLETRSSVSVGNANVVCLIETALCRETSKESRWCV